jgi:hypothetical protein
MMVAQSSFLRGPTSTGAETVDANESQHGAMRAGIARGRRIQVRQWCVSNSATHSRAFTHLRPTLRGTLRDKIRARVPPVPREPA